MSQLIKIETMKARRSFSPFALPFALLSFCLVSCIDAFVPEGLHSQEGLLAVDGVIASGVTVIELHRTVSLGASWADAPEVDAASLYVECDDGSRLAHTSYAGDGVYEIETGALDPRKQYRLHISVDGREYESGYLPPLFSPAIDSISWQKRAAGEPVYITVSTRGDSDGATYYRWTYREDWEFKSELFAEYGQIKGLGYMYFSLATPYNLYYCWGSARSPEPILASTGKLSADAISNKRLVEIPPGSEKLSELYHIAVCQYRIRREAYDYLANLQKNISQTGSIFSPVPGEMEGNIRCLSDPAERVIGYVEVSVPSEKAQFMPELIQAYESPGMNCNLMISTNENAGIVYLTGPPRLYAPIQCLDCTLRGTKNKPAGWPTGHL
jgi:hypothetical protein